MLRRAPKIWKPVIAEQRSKREAALASIGVDWSVGKKRGQAKLEASVRVGRSVNQPVPDKDKKTDDKAARAKGTPACVIDAKAPEGKITAGEESCVVVSVRNRGPGPAFRVHGFSECQECSGSPFDQVEFVLGKLESDEAKSWAVPIKIPKDHPTQMQQFGIHFDEYGGRAPAPIETEVRVNALPLPAYAYSYRLIDEAPNGNGDGLAQVGETLTLRLSVTNQGEGAALETLAMIEDKAGADLFLRKGRISVTEPLAPGDSKTFDFSFQVRGRAEADGRPLELMVRDMVLREYVIERLSFQLREPTAATVKTREGWLSTVADAPLLAGAAEDAREVARVLKGSTLKLVGEIGSFYKVELDSSGETAFLAAAQARPAPAPKGGSADPALVRSPKRRPPEIVIEGADEPLVVRGERYLLKGVARDDSELKDVYIYAGRRKVFFSALDPSRGGRPELPFEVSVPLEEGDNVITVVAREGEDFAARRSVIVRRPVDRSSAKAQR